MPVWIKYVLFTLILLLIASAPLAMQFETGSIQGVITNDLGPVARAFVEAHNVTTGANAHAQSDAHGAYKLDDLQAGRYSLWVQAAGHDSIWLPVVIVERGRVTHLDFHMIRSPGIPTGL
jgi:hypothetical protein